MVVHRSASDCRLPRKIGNDAVVTAGFKVAAATPKGDTRTTAVIGATGHVGARSSAASSSAAMQSTRIGRIE
ncbi:hypothetical protein AYO48_01150 [Gaiella sp. SCGC AG-212-M14]|nr:hypothetical protein AYO48_01150 [Gaiella sp. SCGC AG-212-M14]